MLSICIPIYNFDVTELVNDLHRQCLKAAIEFEIVCFDDGSAENFKLKNQKIQNLAQVRYTELAQNQGRAKIRNSLGKAAQFPYLLFMDCDSQTVDYSYIEKYFKEIERVNVCMLRKKDNLPSSFHTSTLLYGGRVYQDDPPENKSLYFHWKYGINREQQTANIRKMNPYGSFMTNNFLIAKELFLSIQFDEELTQYGHEDTLFGMELKKRNIKIFHLDNPLRHIGLEPTEVFLMKTKQGIQNLYFLSQKSSIMESRLLRYYYLWSNVHLIFLFRWLYAWFKPFFILNFHSHFPFLRLFDLYKLGYLAHISKTSD